MTFSEVKTNDEFNCMLALGTSELRRVGLRLFWIANTQNPLKYLVSANVMMVI